MKGKVKLMKDNDDIQALRKKQVERIKDCITKIVNEYPDYYKDKEYAQKFLNKDNKK